MTSKERVKMVFRGEIPDRVPIGEYAIDSDTVERILGHPTFLRAKAKSRLALWDGRRDEVAQSWKEDFIELHHKLPIFDVLCFGAEATSEIPPEAEHTKYTRLDDVTYQLENGDVYRYSEPTRDLIRVRHGEPLRFDLADYSGVPEVLPPDKRRFEVYDDLLAAFKDDRYVVGISGPEVGLVEMGTTEETLMRYAEDPDMVKAVARWRTLEANALDKYWIRDGLDAIVWGQDHSYKTGPMVSPAMFREFALPVYMSRAASVRSLADVRIVKHACGNNWALLDAYVEAGFDAYQSIQTSAAMDLAKVKAAYGEKLVLWGGVPLELLQNGTIDEVRRASRQALDAGKPGGRYIFGSTHSIATGTKYDNFMAMLDEHHKHSAY